MAEKLENQTVKTTENKEVVKETKKSTPKKITSKKVDKKEVKVEESKIVTEACAKAINVKVTPRKARLVIDTIRGKNVNEALSILNNLSHHKASETVAKLVNSAKANAVNNFNMNEANLYIASIQASDGVKMRRYLPRAKGSASGLVKRYSNIYITIKERL